MDLEFEIELKHFKFPIPLATRGNQFLVQEPVSFKVL